MIRVVVCGASGRMGQTIGRMVKESPDLELAGGINLKSGSFFGAEMVESKNAESLLERTKPDVLIDFTIAKAAVENVKMASILLRSSSDRAFTKIRMILYFRYINSVRLLRLDFIIVIPRSTA